MLVEPGRDQAFYEKHAETSGPWVATIFGFIFIFLAVRRFILRNDGNMLFYALGMPGVYALIDLVILPFTGPDWISGLPLVLLSNAIKMSAGYLAWRMYKITRP
jgi:hypothetical protein